MIDHLLQMSMWRSNIPEINRNSCGLALILALCYSFSLPCIASKKNPESSNHIAINKTVQNVLAPLKSFSLQETDSPATGFFRTNSDVVNAQLIYPFDLSPKWNIITRSNVPVVFQPPSTAAQQRIQGTGNAVSSAFLSPKHPGSFKWGIGPAAVFPTASNPRIGVREWGGGASLVLVKTGKRVVSGVFITQIWTNKDQFNQRINQLVIQPGINYNFPSGFYLTSTPIITAEWQRKPQWLIPVGGGVGKIFNVNGTPINLIAQSFYHVEKPLLTSLWSFRAHAQFFFDTPKWL
jgi:hypothetical protein